MHTRSIKPTMPIRTQHTAIAATEPAASFFEDVAKSSDIIVEEISDVIVEGIVMS